jgi:hypothetical protein
MPLISADPLPLQSVSIIIDEWKFLAVHIAAEILALPRGGGNEKR